MHKTHALLRMEYGEYVCTRAMEIHGTIMNNPIDFQWTMGWDGVDVVGIVLHRAERPDLVERSFQTRSWTSDPAPSLRQQNSLNNLN